MLFKINEELAKKISSVALSIIFIGLITLLIFYFLNPQVEYIYHHDKSIRIDNQIFATLLKPTDVAADSAGNVYVLDAKMIKYKSLLLMVHLLKNGTFKEQKCQNHKLVHKFYLHLTKYIFFLSSVTYYIQKNDLLSCS